MISFKKKFIACFLLVSLAGILAGCTGKEEVSTSSDSTAAIENDQVSTIMTDQNTTESETLLSSESASLSDTDDEEEDGFENSPPEITALELTPNLVYPGTRIKVEAEGRDNEDDAITFFYRWQKNAKNLEGEELDELDTTGFKKGDFITAFVTPFDGEMKGKERMSPSLLISNRPPEITSDPVGQVEKGVFVYNVIANDADGDALQFSLEQFPEGMIIDSATGKIEWKIPDEKKGNIPVKVVVSDGDSQAFQIFNLSSGN